MPHQNHLEDIRRAFPYFSQGAPPIYLDNAATTQRPAIMAEAISHFYRHGNANVHRSSHRLAQHIEEQVSTVRQQVKNLLNARDEEEVIFTKGTTESLNMVAATHGQAHVQQGDEIIISLMEHHSNLLPWQRLCQQKDAHLRVVPLTPKGHIDLEALGKMLGPRTKIVAVSHLSNVLGTINDIASITKLAHHHRAITVVDAAQAMPHHHVDVQALDCDFLAFSAHKMYGPTGLGILYGKREHLEKMTPYQVGGGMVQTLSHATPITYERAPLHLEAGTPHLAGIIGLGATLRFFQQIGYDHLHDHENKMATCLKENLASLPKLRLVGGVEPEIGLTAFNIEGMHPLDVGLWLDARHIIVRTGHFCAQMLMHALREPSGAVRVSCALYNGEEDIKRLTEALRTL